MRLLILSFYFPPDLSAGSFRTRALVDALRRARPDIEIDVITTVPNRYHSHSQGAGDFEDIPGVTVTRLPLKMHKSGMLDQSRVFIDFARQVLTHTRGRRWPLVYATSSRLMTAALGSVVAKRSKAKLYLDIRDLFTDTMNDVMGGSLTRHLLWPFRLIERHTFRAAQRINLVSEGFLDHARAIAPSQSYRTFTNGIDPEFLETDFDKPTRASTEPLQVLYAGNIGEGQGLHLVLPAAAKALAGKAHFTIIGDGGRRVALEQALADAGVSNVTLEAPVPRNQLFARYRAADILFLHLNDHPAFLKVLPSKIFEYGATGKPILAGVGGYAAQFINAQIEGSAVFEPCDVNGMVAAFETLAANPWDGDRSAFKQAYARTTIMDGLAADILAIANQP
ncbi:glycosyltransferase family 4 protein [Devosia sediminis]|uniref:Glycosyltransferase family 4 protein n=1 Tax=Devosia sediminis TaxID=2798801 RepID=A0A934IZI8_9HYPH|nr:glycosyltransferase family 4 protein [Devosia sediminis]MBJ3785075.1 glycosyltransferase family 4 protein [Devosia sediminis]